MNSGVWSSIPGCAARPFAMELNAVGVGMDGRAWALSDCSFLAFDSTGGRMNYGTSPELRGACFGLREWRVV